MARLLVAVCLLAVAAVTGARADGAVFDGALGAGDDTAGVRVLLEVDAQRQRDAQFEQHVAALVSGLHAQADTRAFVIDETDAADAEAEADAAEELNAAAAVAETAAAEELEAEGLADAPVFGEAAEAEAEVFEAVAAPERAEDMAEFSAGPALLEAGAQAQADAEADAEADADSDAAEAEAEAAGGEVFGEAAEEETEIVEAVASEQSVADEREWSAGPAFAEVDAAADADADADADDAAEDEAEDEDAEADEADADADAEDEDEAEAEGEESAFVQVQVQAQARVTGDWKDPPVWWKAPEEEMANADQQPWPLDPNFPMSVLDPPPNLPLANIEDANNYPPMADPNLAFNIDPSAFPQTNPRVGADDPSFASFSINGR